MTLSGFNKWACVAGILVTLRAESLPPLSISPVPPILIPSSSGPAKRSILVTGPGEITVTGSSSHQQIVRDSDIVVSPRTGPAGPRKLFLVPQLGVQGETTITLRASGGGAEYSTTFPVRVEFIDPYRFEGGPIQINDNAPATPYPSTITVSNLPGILRKVQVTLSAFSHTFPEDVDILLESPSGEKVLLLSDVGGGNQVTNLNLVFGAGEENLIGTNALVSGIFAASDYGAEPDIFPAPAPAAGFSRDMAAFLDKSPNGDWKLWVVDDAAGDWGAIAGWTLVFETEEITLSVHNADQALAISVHGNVGTRVAVERSSDLQSWTPLHEDFLDLDGKTTTQVSRTEAANRFFRAKRIVP